MQKLKSKKWLPLIMVITILAIAGFQAYWLQKSYDREERTLEMRSYILFRETIRSLQASKLKLDRFIIDTSSQPRLFAGEHGHERDRMSRHEEQKMIGMMDALAERTHDTGKPKIIISRGDSVRLAKGNISPRQGRFMQFLFDIDSMQDSINVQEIQTVYREKLKEQKISIPFSVAKVPTPDTDQPEHNQVTLGFRKPVTFQLNLGNTLPFLLKRLTAPILFSLFLVGFTILSFSLLFRNLMRQRKLAEIKNDFISNITHELKTPIATVSVAIEALRSFSSSIDANRRKEYLDISANELQRLSLLVDKVLKLSMFEKREIELKYEPLDMKLLVDEVCTSLRLQFEKRKACVHVSSDGNTSIEGDRLHLVSVIFNLVDNALKYSGDKPHIEINVKDANNFVILTIADTGIGISPEYHGRIFEKFFRVPTGNLHNAKGYGLGLSYVAHVIDKHHGDISVDSLEGKGTKFIISLPRTQNS
jgi:two-component system, OmpR family, phosphate regulon sensor histidine kinase PhoR